MIEGLIPYIKHLRTTWTDKEGHSLGLLEAKNIAEMHANAHPGSKQRQSYEGFLMTYQAEKRHNEQVNALTSTIYHANNNDRGDLRDYLSWLAAELIAKRLIVAGWHKH